MSSPQAGRPVAALSMFEPVTRDLLTDAHRERLERLCRVPRPEPIMDFDDESVAGLLGDVEILITSWGTPKVDRRRLAQMPRLRLVANAAGTVRWVVRDSFWEGDVALSSAADANAVPVAEFTLAAIVFAAKRVVPLQRRYAERRKWEIWSEGFEWIGTRDRLVGLVGASRIGRRVIELLRPLDLAVQVHDPYLDEAEAAELGVEAVSLDELVRTSDIVSLHAPLLPDTKHLIGARELGLLRDGAVLINTARGGLVDQDALLDELRTGRIEAMLDVTDPEILDDDDPLYELPNVFLTPHIAGAQGSETARLMDFALDEVERFLRDEPLRGRVEQADLDRIA